MLQNDELIINLLNNTNEKSVPNLLQHMSFRHYKLESKLSLSLVTIVIHLTENCHCNVENVTMKQSIGIPMG